MVMRSFYVCTYICTHVLHWFIAIANIMLKEVVKTGLFVMFLTNADFLRF